MPYYLTLGSSHHPVDVEFPIAKFRLVCKTMEYKSTVISVLIYAILCSRKSVVKSTDSEDEESGSQKKKFLDSKARLENGQRDSSLTESGDNSQSYFNLHNQTEHNTSDSPNVDHSIINLNDETSTLEDSSNFSERIETHTDQSYIADYSLSESPLSVKFETRDIDNKDLKDKHLTLYEVTEIRSDCYLYQFYEFARCIEVNYKDHVVWSHKEDNKKYPTQIFFDSSSDTIEVYLDNGFKLVYNHYEENLDPSQFIYPDNNDTQKLETHEITQPQQNISTSQCQPKLPSTPSTLETFPFCETDELIELDINKTRSTNEFEYSKTGNLAIYTTKQGYSFYLVKKGKGSSNCCGVDKVIWEATNSSEYSKKVIIQYFANKIMTIHYVNGKKKMFKNNDDTYPWVETKHLYNLSSLLEVDINKGESTDKFDCSNDGKVATYTPKQGYSFYLVKKGKGSCCGSDEIIWEATNSSEFSNKVVAEGDKFLKVHLVSGITKVFKLSKNYDILLETNDSSTIPSLIELDINKTNGTNEFDCSKNGNVVTYTPKQGYGFYLVKKGKERWNCRGSDEIVWESINSSQHSNKVVEETGSNKDKRLTIYFPDGTINVYKKPKDSEPYLHIKE